MIHFHFASVVHLVKLEFEIIKLVIFTGGGGTCISRWISSPYPCSIV